MRQKVVILPTVFAVSVGNTTSENQHKNLQQKSGTNHPKRNYGDLFVRTPNVLQPCCDCSVQFKNQDRAPYYLKVSNVSLMTNNQYQACSVPGSNSHIKTCLPDAIKM